MIQPGTYCNVVIIGVADGRVRVELSGGFNADELQRAILVLQEVANDMEGE